MRSKQCIGIKVTEEVSGNAADFLLFSKRTATGPSCGKSIHVPHLCAFRGSSLVSSKLLKSRKSAACPETPSVTLSTARTIWGTNSVRVCNLSPIPPTVWCYVSKPGYS